MENDRSFLEPGWRDETSSLFVRGVNDPKTVGNPAEVRTDPRRKYVPIAREVHSILIKYWIFVGFSSKNQIFPLDKGIMVY